MTLVRRESLDDGIVGLVLDRPERLNALSFAVVEELHAALADIGADNGVRVVVLTGAGRAFCSGLDLADIGPSTASRGLSGPAAGMRSQERIADLVTQLRRIPQPVIAAVNGAAFGGGLALACACDLRVIATTARLCVQFINVGVSGCDIGISYTLPRLIGASRAHELMLTGREFSAAEADRWGLASAVVPADEVLGRATDLARRIRAHTPFGVTMTKDVMWANLDASSLAGALALENRTQILAGQTGTVEAAARAFLAGRRDRPPPADGAAGLGDVPGP